jgi:CheY-like chemotaxis protein
MKSVLVAEDRETSRELIRTVLEHCGYAVIEATNGQEAIALACEKRPDLLLLDLQMPIKNGFETVMELRSDERFRLTPIVALTASAMYGDRERALQDGFSAYLTKPLSVAAMRTELSRLLPE